MGLRNPFRFDVDARGTRLHRRLLARLARAQPGPRPRGHRPVVRDQRGRQLRLAVLLLAELPYIDFDFATRTSGAAVQLRRAGQRLATATPA